MRTLPALLLTTWLLGGWPTTLDAQSHSSGGHSYSSHSSSSSSSSSHSSSPSHSYSSGGSSSSANRSSSSGSSFKSSGSSSSSSHSSSPPGSSKSFNSSSGKSYGSSSTRSDDSKPGYSSGKSYSSGSERFSTAPAPREIQSRPATPKKSGSTSDDFKFDSAAAQARKEEASKQTFTQYKESQLPKPVRTDSMNVPPPVPASSTVNNTGYNRRTVYVPDAQIISTRRIRSQTFFYPYYSQPVVIYRDPYSSFFWWWLLDRTANDRALWAYHHRADMDAARYQALAARDIQFESRIQQLEQQQVAVDANYVPTELDRDLMYTDEHVQREYSNRPTTSGRTAFWIFAVPAAAAMGYVFIWLVFFKRWQTST